MADDEVVVPLKGKARSLPEWFPLPCYAKTLNPEQWVAHIMFRLAVRTAFRNTGDAKKARETFDSLIVQSDYSVEDGDKLVNKNPRWPVANLNVFEAFYLAAQWKPDEHERLRDIAHMLANNPRPGVHVQAEPNEYNNNLNTLPDAMRVADNEDDGYRQAEIVSWRVPVSIDITQDDESLKAAFEFWLAGLRCSQNEPPPKTADKKEMQRWQAFRLLPAFDLNLWGEVTGHRFTDAFMGHALWPDQDPDSGFVDTTERYRKTTKPLLEKVFNWGFAERMANDLSQWRYLQAKHAEAVARGEAKPLLEDL